VAELRGVRHRGRASRRAGHGVAVLLKIYAHCIDGQADAANQRITDALGAKDTEPERLRDWPRRTAGPSP
jgi:hypothetical protein